MKKLIFCGITIAILSLVAFFASGKQQISELTPTQLANIEALSEYEHPDYENYCYTYCKNRSGYVCYINLSNGITIYCDEMVHWSFIPGLK